MKIFAATLATETNTFTAVPTGRVDFEVYGFYRGNGSVASPQGIGVFHAELKRLAQQDGHTVIESIAGFAQPAGRTLRAVYEDYRSQLLEDLAAALPIDAVQLYLHGAMVAQDYDDCEGDIIARVRDIVGSAVPIGVELDLHCHTTELMLRSADLIICYKEYPHTDSLDRLRELYRLTLQQAAGQITPVTAMYDCRMLGMWNTTVEPVKSFVARLQSFESKDGVLSVSLGYGFPLGDVADAGARLWVVTDNDLAKAEALAQRLGREFWDMRFDALQLPTPLPQAIAQIRAHRDGLLVMADVGDNPGGGAMGDSNFVLQALLDAGIGDFAIGCYWDLGAVALCRSAGVGASLDLRIGGKCGPMSGTPIDLRVTVRAIVENHSQFGLNARYPMGCGVWVQADKGIDIVLVTQRGQVLAPEAFEGLGIKLGDKKLVVVKSAQHFFATFGAIAAETIYVGAPGATAKDFSVIPYKKRSLDFWPVVENPWSA
ncbi:M81 family metallopeptidase [Hydrocarboniphaga sp.]|uniref:M81 family metallopeptidase n=1 Tax=Hydrocarboniphaga sp. TaxID=2033016 RepID=UPI003D0DDBAD